MKKEDLLKFNEMVKNIDGEFKVDYQFMIFHKTPAVYKKLRNKDDEFIELSIYYNYKKELVTAITRNRIISEDEHGMLSTEIETIKRDFETVKQQSKKNVLEKIQELKNIDLNIYA